MPVLLYSVMVIGMKWHLLFIGCIILAPQAFGLELTEIMYNPVGTDTGHEWVEFHVDDTLNLTRIRFHESEGNHFVSVVQGEQIAEPGEFVIVSNNATAFLQEHAGFEGTVLQSPFSLSNSGEQIGILDDAGVFLDEVTYSNQFANGNGKTLEKVDGAWVESPMDGGTPGFGEQHEVPEFTAAAAGVALCAALAGMMILRGR